MKLVTETTSVPVAVGQVWKDNDKRGGPRGDVRMKTVHGRWWLLWHSGVLPFTVIHPDHPDYPMHYVGQIAQHIEERRRVDDHGEIWCCPEAAALSTERDSAVAALEAIEDIIRRQRSLWSGDQ